MALGDQNVEVGDLLEDLNSFPLLTAMFGRRARRFGVGMRIPDGPLAYESTQEPVPLTDLERYLLVLCGSGISGWNTGMEHTAAGDPDKGCNYPIRLVGRTYPSAAGIGASELIFTDDSGTYMTQYRDLDAQRLREFEQVTDFDSLVSKARQNCVRLADGRVEVPAIPPHLSPHNFWNANKPGTTLFIPVVDLTQQMLDLLAIYAGTGFVPFDPVHDSLCGDLDRFIESGLLDGNKRFSIVDFEHYALATGAMEIALVCYNLVLTMQAMGLGGWMFTGINPPSLMGAFAKDGITGLGFRFTPRPPGTQPNPVGVDNYFEGLCPPYYSDMREAVDKFVDMKFGRGGTYDPQRPGPFRDNASVKSDIQRYTPEFVECLGEIAQYMHDAFGKFPATIPSTYARVYAQAQHIDMDFYDRFYGPESYVDSHRDHMARWHGDQEGS
jgi:hypothetical protein